MSKNVKINRKRFIKLTAGQFGFQTREIKDVVMPCPAPVTSTEKGRAIETNYFRNAGSRLPQP